MSSFSTVWTMGIEEEYQIIDPWTRALAPDASRMLSSVESPFAPSIQLQQEMQRSQVEIATPICSTLAEVRSSLTQARQTASAAAERIDRQIGGYDANT